jgi:YfiR/HmsC-like
MMSSAKVLMMMAMLGVLTGRAALARDQTPSSPVDELTVKAAFVYNFILFTQWPSALPDTVRLCLLGHSAMEGPLRLLNGRPLAGKSTLAALNVRPGDPLDDCHAVYIDDSQRQHARSTLARLRGLPVLTVTDAEGLAEQGVMIEITRQGPRLGFEVNLGPSTRARLQFSSRMLKLASHVIPAHSEATGGS